MWMNMWEAGKTACDPSLTPAGPERFRDEYHTHEKAHYTNVLFTHFTGIILTV